MKIIKFRIKNYKSIKDSGECYLDDRITILAGRNESGKTSIVEALEDFNTGAEIKKDAIPIWNDKAIPEIRISIKLDKKDIIKIKERINLEKTDKEVFLDIIKRYPNDYVIPDESLFNIDPELRTIPDFDRNVREIIADIEGRIVDFKIPRELLKSHEDLLNELQDSGMQYFPEPKNKEQKEIIKKGFDGLIRLLKIIVDLNASKLELRGYVKKYLIPNFILFRTFDDILPNEIEITQAEDDSLIKDLSLISDLDFDLIHPDSDPRKKEKHKEAVNIKFSDEYKQFWKQDHSNLFISWDSDILYFWIKERGDYYYPKMRSRGRQWHLSFYIRVTARSLERKNNVILIDEPGLFLHARAQKDILKKLDACSKNNQIIYTTHSPYLIPSKKLDRVRLVLKNRSGTKIKKITAKADKETLTPILTAIGEDLSVGIRVDRKNSIVVEGYSDYLYLSCFKDLLEITDKLNFVPSVGADSSLFIGSILFGWKLSPIFILDNDANGKRVKRKLMERLALDEERIILVPEKDEGCIENLFSKKDFNRCISEGASNKGKVLLALEFMSKIERDELKLSDFSKETIENFEGLFKKLKELTK